MFTVALLLAATAVALSVAKLTTNTATTTTVTAAPPAADLQPRPGRRRQKRSRATPALDADNDLSPLRSAIFSSPHSDRQSPEYRPALGNFQLVAYDRNRFPRKHLTASGTRKTLKMQPTATLQRTLALVDANTRELSIKMPDHFVDAVEGIW